MSSRDSTLTESFVRYLLPSAADLLFVILLAALGASSLSSRLLNDAGIGWHIRNGELIWRSQSITRTDPFSATMQGRSWYAWEYLFDLMVARLHSWAGLNAVTFFAALIIAAAFATALRISVRRGSFLLLALPLLAMAIAASSIHFFARPHVLSWLLALIWFQILESDWDSTTRRRLWFLPLIMLLWVNVHGGFLLGFILLALYLIAAILACFTRPKAGINKQRIGSLAIITAACAITSLLNPYGYHLHQHVFEYLSNRWLMNHIDEFRAPNFHGLPQQCFAMLLIVSAISLALVRKKPPFRMVLVILFAVFSGLYAARNLPIASLLLVVSIAPVLSQALREAVLSPAISFRPKKLIAAFGSFAARTNSFDRRLAGHLWPLAAIVLGIGICAHQGRVGKTPIMNAEFDSRRFPAHAVDFISAQQIREPVFSLDSWGGYLIYRLYPQTQVVVDDRHDLYGSSFMKQYLGTIRLVPEWNDLLEQQHVQWVLMPRQSALSNMLRELPGWKLAYGDKTAEIFQKER